MQLQFKTLILVLSLLLTFQSQKSYAQNPPAQEGGPAPQQMVISIPDFMSMFTVKVHNSFASMFSPQLNGGVGTGFVVNRLKNKDGVDVVHIFTNKHVIDMPSNYMQNLKVSFHSDPKSTDLDAKLIYRSDLHDFAVLEVPVAEIIKHKFNMQGAPLPLSQHDHKSENGQGLNQLEAMIRQAPMFYEGIKGGDTIAIGNPLGGDDIFTKGRVSGFRMADFGPVIQTTTPINPGNSGGPLLLQVGPSNFVVVGINTAIIMGAQNVSFSIPIGPLMAEYQNFLNGHVVPRPKDYVAFTPVLPPQMKNYGYDALIKKVRANDDGGPILQVAGVTPGSPFKINDILLTIQGQRVHAMYEYKRNMLMTNYKKIQSLKVEVLRNGEIVKLDMPLAPLEFAQARKELDFVYLSGFVFKQLPGKMSVLIRPDIKSRVFVSDIVTNPEMMFAPRLTVIPPMSLLHSIDVDGKTYEIVSLLDLKKAMQTVTASSVVLAHYYPVIKSQKSDAEEEEHPRAAGPPQYSDVLMHTRIQDPEVRTPRNLSLRDLREKADLDPHGDAKTRHWRNYVKPKEVASGPCKDALQ